MLSSELKQEHLVALQRPDGSFDIQILELDDYGLFSQKSVHHKICVQSQNWP